MEIFTDWTGLNGAGQFLARFGHYLGGAAWIGLLWYYNFIQVPAFGEMTVGARSEAIREISTRVVSWTRWSALATLATGIAILAFQQPVGVDFADGGPDYLGYLRTTRGTAVAFGSVLGIIMLINVWAVIVPSQRAIVASAEAASFGRAPDTAATHAAKRLARASRCNVVLSIPMLWFMVAPSHLAGASLHFVIMPGRDLLGAVWTVFVIAVGVIELSALGAIGGLDSRTNRWLFDDHRRSVAGGIGLLIVLWVGAFEIMIGSASPT